MHKRMVASLLPHGASSLVVLAFVLAGCAASPPKEEARRPAESESSAAIEARTVSISDVRSDFEDAIEYLQKENYEKGIELLKKVTAQPVNDAAPYINLAMAYQKVGDLPLAEENLKKALAISVEHPVANNEYGLVYRKTGRFKEAKTAYEKTLAKHPSFLPARKNLAILCDLYLKDFDCALTNYQIYSAAVPDDKNVRIWIADVEKRLGK